MVEAKRKKSFFITYVLWLFGGFFGLHHIYLRRDKHAFLTFSLCGGYFGFGLIRDLWRIPEYLNDANNDRKYLDWLHDQMKLHKKPPHNLIRQSASLIVSSLYAHLASYAIPRELLPESVVTFLEILLVPFGASLGVWLVGNVGRHQGSIMKPMLAAYLSVIPSFIPSIYYDFNYMSPFAAHITFNRFCKQWRREPQKPKPLLKRLSILSIAVLIYLSLWSSGLYFSCTIKEPETNETIKCRVAMDNLLKSQAFANISDAVKILMEHVRYNGIGSIWREIMQEFDVSGKSNAFNVLGLKEGATPEEILLQYKKLSREYHPDREKDGTKKAEKNEKFIQVQEAFKILEAYVDRYKIKRQNELNNEERHESGAVTKDEL